MKAKYELASNEVIELTRKVINMFPEKFIHIKVEDLHFIFKDVDKSKVAAHVRKLSGSLQTLTQKKIEFCMWKTYWEQSNQFERMRVIYHELTHIGYDDDKQKYQMVRHDIEEFKESLKLFGLNGENTEAIFSARMAEKQIA
jgi:glucosamine 6-phosphate synthetase-like amidotransferase/phosphosugar isomerase protein